MTEALRLRGGYGWHLAKRCKPASQTTVCVEWSCRRCRLAAARGLTHEVDWTPLVEHMGFVHDAVTTRKLRPQVEALIDARSSRRKKTWPRRMAADGLRTLALVRTTGLLPLGTSNAWVVGGDDHRHRPLLRQLSGLTLARHRSARPRVDLPRTSCRKRCATRPGPSASMT